jgi:hypothetical protein
MSDFHNAKIIKYPCEAGSNIISSARMIRKSLLVLLEKLIKGTVSRDGG